MLRVSRFHKIHLPKLPCSITNAYQKYIYIHISYNHYIILWNIQLIHKITGFLVTIGNLSNYLNPQDKLTFHCDFSIHSNCQALSHDIRRGFSNSSCVWHLTSGGRFYEKSHPTGKNSDPSNIICPTVNNFKPTSNDAMALINLDPNLQHFFCFPHSRSTKTDCEVLIS